MARSLRSFLLVLVSSALLVLPYHFGGLWPLAFFAFVPYFFAVDGRSRGDAFKISYSFGVFFFLSVGYWLTLVNVFGFIVLVLYLALYFGLFGFFYASRLAGLERKLPALLAVPSAWLLSEYLRGIVLGGLPWTILAYSQWLNVPFIQIAEITGAWGVSFIVLLINFLIFRILRDRKFEWLVVGLLFVSLFGTFGYGFASLGSREALYKKFPAARKIRIAVIQGNIPQEEKWDARIKDIVFEKQKRLMFMSALERPDLIVWPETSFPGYFEDEPALAMRLRQAVRQSQTFVLVGAPTFGDLEKGLKFYNSAVLFDPAGEEKKRYDKLHLVPFGEYIPFEFLIGWIRNWVPIGHFSPGSEYTVFTISKAKFGVLICFEDIFPNLVRGFVNRGADFLVNMTNDAWFGKTSAPYQHAQGSVFRAIENRVPVARAANTGFSCFISPEGRILSAVNDKGREIFVSGHRLEVLTLLKTPTFYTRFGDVWVFLAALVLFLVHKFYRINKLWPHPL